MNNKDYLTIQYEMVVECDKAAKEVIIPDGVRIIAREAFEDCTVLDSG
ncbi:MAG: leucine-rich repeat domain-containing protein [Lachnoclostridium sp.]|nr:leucine-rich repeat domain-containing protein [Lachnospira sp.]MCM1248067.1 leucine-rich repeat domain-containing protein [Lachnoclostridium sp.]